VDRLGNAYLAGSTSEGDFPVTSNAFQKTLKSSDADAFVAELNSSGSALIYSTYLGGSSPYSDGANGIALDGSGNVYVAGGTSSDDFPVTTSVFQTANSGENGFVAKFAFGAATTFTLTSNANPETEGTEVTFTAHVAPVTGGGVPTGTVRFAIHYSEPQVVPLDGSGGASYSTSTLPVGANPILATYLGDEKFAPGAATVTQTITGQVAAPNFNPLGGTHTSSALPVTIATASPGATIYYTTDGTIPSPSSSTKYVAPVLISGPLATIKAIAVESGDTQSAVATAAYSIVPPAIKTTTSLQSSLNPSIEGQSVTCTATAASGLTPTGSVTFKQGSTVLGSVPLTGGEAQFTTSALTPNDYNFIAVYTGSTTDASSYSATLSQKVNAP